MVPAGPPTIETVVLYVVHYNSANTQDGSTKHMKDNFKLYFNVKGNAPPPIKNSQKERYNPNKVLGLNL